MANNNRIKLLRGNSTQIANSNKVLSYGQPLYNDDKNYITVGNSAGTKQVKAQPITVREVIGYYGDSTTISNSTSNQYKLSGDATNKTYLNTPDTFNINVNNVNKVSIDGTTATIKENVVVDNTYKITTPDIETSKLNGVAISNIFEDDDKTVKEATNSTKVDNHTLTGNVSDGYIIDSTNKITTKKLVWSGKYCVSNLTTPLTDNYTVFSGELAETLSALWNSNKTIEIALSCGSVFRYRRTIPNYSSTYTPAPENLMLPYLCKGKTTTEGADWVGGVLGFFEMPFVKKTNQILYAYPHTKGYGFDGTYYWYVQPDSSGVTYNTSNTYLLAIYEVVD